MPSANVGSFKTMNKISLGLDLDGVLFDFNTAFVNLARQYYPDLKCKEPSALWPTSWDYMNDHLSEAEIDVLWRFVCHESVDFWAKLPRYPWSQELLQHALADQSFHIYYITSRPGRNVQLQSEEALENLAWATGERFRGGVIPVSAHSRKPPLIKALDLTHFVDDKAETVEAAFHTCLNTEIAVWDQPWNQHMQTPGITRLKTPEDFVQWLKA